MVGEKFGAAGGAGESQDREQLTPEQLAEKRRQEGEKVIEAANHAEEQESQSAPEEQRAGDKVEWNRENAEKLLRGLKDKNGNPYLSEKSIENILKSGKEVDPAEEDRELAIKKAQDAAYKSAQAEIARELKGKSIDKYLVESQRELLKLKGEIERMRATKYSDPEKKKKLLAEAEGDFLSMNRRRKMIEGLKAGDKIVPVASSEYGDFSAVSAELDVNQPESATGEKMIQAAFEQILRLGITKEDPEFAAKLLLKMREFQKEAKKRELEEGFADTGESGSATDEEVAQAAAEAGGDGGKKTGNKVDRTKAKNAKKTNAKEAQGESYAEKLTKVANETKAGSWMSDEEKAQAAESAEDNERKDREKRVANKARKRKGFKRIVARVLALIGVGATLAGSSPSTASAAETVAVTESETDRQMREQAEVAAAAAQLGIEPAELVQKNLLDYDAVPEQAIYDLGVSYYEGFMERENSQEMANGLQANYTLYESKKNSKNSYGPDQSYIYDMTEGRVEAEQKSLLELIRDQPQALASFTANYPRMLKACGVDNAILQDQNLETRSQAIMNLMLGEGGGMLQKKLMGAAAMAITNENTTFDFYMENGLERSFYMKQIDPNAPNTPDNIVLKTAKVWRDNVPQVQITVTYADGIQEYSDQNLRCDNQSNMTANTYRKRESVIEVRIDTQAEQVEEAVPNVPEDTPGDEPGGKPDDTPDDKPDDTPDDTPDEEPDDEEDDDDEEEDVKPKSPEGEQEVVDEGGQTNPVEPTPEGDLTEETTEEEATPSEGNQQQTEDGQVADQTVDEEQQQQDQQNQEDANQNEITDNISDEDFLDFVNEVIESINADGTDAAEVSADASQAADSDASAGSANVGDTTSS